MIGSFSIDLLQGQFEGKVKIQKKMYKSDFVWKSCTLLLTMIITVCLIAK